jgi:peptidoglycan-N-acetylglucosamine deacetylase
MKRLVLAFGFLLAALVPVASAPQAPQRLTAFYVPWDPAAAVSLKAHIGALSTFSPQWILLKNAQGELVFTPDAAALDILAAAKHSPKVMPLVANVHDGVWDTAAVGALVADAAVRGAVLDRLVELAKKNHFAGYIFDLEDLSPEAISAQPAFAAAVSARFGAEKLEYWQAVPIDDKDWPLRAMQDAGANLVLMAYDQCWDGSVPGPIAGLDWFSATLQRRLSGLDKSRLMVALASYAYDWPQHAPAKVLSAKAARQLAQDSNVALRGDAPVYNSTFDYRAGNMAHTVWLMDAKSFALQKALLRKLGVGRIGLWRLGLEDENVWNANSRTVVPAITKTPPSSACEPLQ